MRFWDASALVPLLLAESTSASARRALAGDLGLIVWWGTRVECTAALARAERDGRITSEDARRAFRDLERLNDDWTEIDPNVGLRQMAERLLRTHPLRAADALQLAAATVAAEGRPGNLSFVTLDDRLAIAADREGFPVVRFEQPSG